jgi:elongation factor Tu
LPLLAALTAAIATSGCGGDGDRSGERDVEKGGGQKPLLMPVEEVATIKGRGTLVTGRVERGTIKVGDSVELVGIAPDARRTIVIGLEMGHKKLTVAVSGDTIGVLLKGVSEDEVSRGQVLAQPGTASAHARFRADVHILSEEEGGRPGSLFDGFSPDFRLRTALVGGTVALLGGQKSVVPGDDARVEITLATPVAMAAGLELEIVERGRTIGTGIVTKVVD